MWLICLPYFKDAWWKKSYPLKNPFQTKILRWFQIWNWISKFLRHSVTRGRFSLAKFLVYPRVVKAIILNFKSFINHFIIVTFALELEFGISFMHFCLNLATLGVYLCVFRKLDKKLNSCLGNWNFIMKNGLKNDFLFYNFISLVPRLGDNR